MRRLQHVNSCEAYDLVVEIHIIQEAALAVLSVVTDNHFVMPSLHSLIILVIHTRHCQFQCQPFQRCKIVARKVFNHSFQGVDELGGYALAIAGAVGFGYAALTCSQTRIGLVLSKLPVAAQAVLHVLAAAVLMVVADVAQFHGQPDVGADEQLCSDGHTALYPDGRNPR